MADLNALIAQGAQFNLPNPVDQYSKVMQLQQMGQANQLNKLKMDEYTRGIDEQNKLRQVMATPGFDVSKPEHQAALLQAAPNTAPALLEKLAQVQKEKAQTEHFGAQTGKLNYEVESQKLTQGLNEISNMPDINAAYASIDSHVADKSISPEKAAQLKAQIKAAPDFQTWQKQTVTGMLAAKDRLDAMANQRFLNPPSAAPAADKWAAPSAFTTKDANGNLRYVVNGMQVSPEEYQSAQAGVTPQATPTPKMMSYSLPAAPETSMAPASSTAPAQPDVMNALTLKIQGLEEQRNKLRPNLDAPIAMKQYEALGKQIEDLNKGFSVAPGAAHVVPGVGTIERAPTSADVTTMKALGYPVTEEGFRAFNDAKRQDRLLTPQEEAQKLRLAKAGATNVNVNAGQKAEDVEFGKFVVDQYKDVSNRAQLAARSLPAIDINLRTLDKGFDTGFGTETKAAGASVLAALGVKDAAQYATDAQTFLANANSAVLQKQLEQKGPQTDSDAQRINATGAQLGNTKEANKFILSVAKAQLQRDIDQRKFYSDWQAEHKTFRGAEDAWATGPGSASLFDSPLLKKYVAPAPAAQTETRKAGLDKIFGGKR